MWLVAVQTSHGLLDRSFLGSTGEKLLRRRVGQQLWNVKQTPGIAHSPFQLMIPSHIVSQPLHLSKAYLFWALIFWPTKVPCSHIVKQARAELRTQAHAGRLLRRFANVRLKDAERGVHRIFVEEGFAVPIPIERINVGAGALAKFPIIKFSSWVKYLLDTNRLRQLTGMADFQNMKATLGEWWSRFRALYPEHGVFRLANEGQLCLELTIPFYSHTDEGRSYKHALLWVLSSHGCIGRGTRAFIKKGELIVNRPPLRRKSMGVNFVGNTWSTQFIFCSILRAHFAERPEILEALVAAYASDVASLATDGVTSSDGRTQIWCVHVGTKADLPALAKLGGFKRSFGNVPRAPSSRSACRGICHLCLAGREAPNGDAILPFEDMSLNPAWLATMDAEEPWTSTPAILNGALIEEGRQAQFFLPDIWHNVHMGIGKSWASSSFVTLAELSDNLPGNSMQARFDFLSRDYLDFCARCKVQPFVDGINRETMCFPQSSATPEGKWSKAACTTIMLKYLENLASRFIAGHTDNNILLAIVFCLQNSHGKNQVLSIFFGWAHIGNDFLSKS